MLNQSTTRTRHAGASGIPDIPCFGRCEATRRLSVAAAKAAQVDATVFLMGESGSGKDILARAIHDASARREHPFIAVNCGAISHTLAHAELFGHEKGSFTDASSQNAGYFEHASGGTLFLDEVTEMSPDLQVHFLRVLETGSYQRVGGTDLLRADVRIICATNRDPHQAVSDGILRQDFLHRLWVLPLRVPPLRERPEDVHFLALQFLDELNTQYGLHKHFSCAMWNALAFHDWPGNVRELRNVVQRAYILCNEELDSDCLDRARGALRDNHDAGTLTFSIGTPLNLAQRELILATLMHHQGDKKQTARSLGISLKTLYNRLDMY